MKILTFRSKHATFFLNGVDIGDYIEAEFRAPLGIVAYFNPPPESTLDRFPMHGYSLLLTLWCDHAEPIPVEFRTPSKQAPNLLAQYGYGSKLILTPTLWSQQQHNWNLLTINGQHALTQK